MADGFRCPYTKHLYDNLKRFLLPYFRARSAAGGKFSCDKCRSFVFDSVQLCFNPSSEEFANLKRDLDTAQAGNHKLNTENEYLKLIIDKKNTLISDLMRKQKNMGTLIEKGQQAKQFIELLIIYLNELYSEFMVFVKDDTKPILLSELKFLKTLYDTDMNEKDETIRILLGENEYLKQLLEHDLDLESNLSQQLIESLRYDFEQIEQTYDAARQVSSSAEMFQFNADNSEVFNEIENLLKTDIVDIVVNKIEGNRSFTGLKNKAINVEYVENIVSNYEAIKNNENGSRESSAAEQQTDNGSARQLFGSDRSFMDSAELLLSNRSLYSNQINISEPNSSRLNRETNDSDLNLRNTSEIKLTDENIVSEADGAGERELFVDANFTEVVETSENNRKDSDSIKSEAFSKNRSSSSSTYAASAGLDSSQNILEAILRKSIADENLNDSSNRSKDSAKCNPTNDLESESISDSTKSERVEDTISTESSVVAATNETIDNPTDLKSTAINPRFNEDICLGERSSGLEDGAFDGNHLFRKSENGLDSERSAAAGSISKSSSFESALSEIGLQSRTNSPRNSLVRKEIANSSSTSTSANVTVTSIGSKSDSSQTSIEKHKARDLSARDAIAAVTTAPNDLSIVDNLNGGADDDDVTTSITSNRTLSQYGFKMDLTNDLNSIGSGERSLETGVVIDHNLLVASVEDGARDGSYERSFEAFKNLNENLISSPSFERSDRLIARDELVGGSGKSLASVRSSKVANDGISIGSGQIQAKEGFRQESIKSFESLKSSNVAHDVAKAESRRESMKSFGSLKNSNVALDPVKDKSRRESNKSVETLKSSNVALDPVKNESQRESNKSFKTLKSSNLASDVAKNEPRRESNKSFETLKSSNVVLDPVKNESRRDLRNSNVALDPVKDESRRESMKSFGSLRSSSVAPNLPTDESQRESNKSFGSSRNSKVDSNLAADESRRESMRSFESSMSSNVTQNLPKNESRRESNKSFISLKSSNVALEHANEKPRHGSRKSFESLRSSNLAPSSITDESHRESTKSFKSSNVALEPANEKPRHGNRTSFESSRSSKVAPDLISVRILETDNNSIANESRHERSSVHNAPSSNTNIEPIRSLENVNKDSISIQSFKTVAENDSLRDIIKVMISDRSSPKSECSVSGGGSRDLKSNESFVSAKSELMTLDGNEFPDGSKPEARDSDKSRSIESPKSDTEKTLEFENMIKSLKSRLQEDRDREKEMESVVDDVDALVQLRLENLNLANENDRLKAKLSELEKKSLNKDKILLQIQRLHCLPLIDIRAHCLVEISRNQRDQDMILSQGDSAPENRTCLHHDCNYARPDYRARIVTTIQTNQDKVSRDVDDAYDNDARPKCSIRIVYPDLVENSNTFAVLGSGSDCAAVLEVSVVHVFILLDLVDATSDANDPPVFVGNLITIYPNGTKETLEFDFLQTKSPQKIEVPVIKIDKNDIVNDNMEFVFVINFPGA